VKNALQVKSCSEKNLPTLKLLIKIAEALDCDVREILHPTNGNAVTQEDVNNAMELIKKGVNILEGVKKVPLKQIANISMRFVIFF